MGWEVDLRASYPTMIVGLMQEMGRRTERNPEMRCVEEYVRKTDEMRARVARDYGTNPNLAKQLFNRIIFGGGIAKWKKDFGIEAQARSEDAEKFEKQMNRARVLIAADERRNGGAKGAKDKTLVSRAVGRVEERLMAKMSEVLAGEGWKTGSLIHDAIIIGKEGDQRRPKEQQEELEQIVRTVLRGAMEERG